MNKNSENKDVRMVDVPQYMEWSKRKLHDGESPAIISHLDATSLWATTEDIAALSDDDFDDMLKDLKVGLGLG